MGETTRDRLIAVGLRTLLRHGYDGAALAVILAEADVPKGSFYHFFKSKDEFAIAVIDAYALKYQQMRERLFNDRTITPLARLFAYFNELEAEIADDMAGGGCLYGVLSQTIGARGTALRSKLMIEYKAWERSIQSVLDEAKTAGQLPKAFDCKASASLVIDLYEGALVRMKTENDLSAFQTLHRHLQLLLGGNASSLWHKRSGH